MKLTTINRSDNSDYDGIRILLGDYPTTIVESIIYRTKHGRTQQHNILPQAFLESVRQANVISEGQLLDMLKSGLEQLRAIITPGPSGDLSYLLGMMAPRSGGLEEVKKLLAQAKALPTNLLSDGNNEVKAWWLALQAVFQGTPELAQHIKEQVRNDVLNTGLQDQPTAQPEKPGTAAKLAADAKPVAAPRPSAASTQPAANQRQFDFMQQEDIIRSVCLALLEDQRVLDNIQYIGNATLQKLVAKHNTQVPILNEAGLRDRLLKALNRGRTSLANPGTSRRQSANNQLSALNTRIAKLAIQAYGDDMKTRFGAKLEAAGMTPDDIANAYKIYSQDKSNQKAKDIVQKAVRLFNPQSDIIDAELVKPEEPVGAELVGQETLQQIANSITQLPENIATNLASYYIHKLTPIGRTTDKDKITEFLRKKVGDHISKERLITTIQHLNSPKELRYATILHSLRQTNEVPKSETPYIGQAWNKVRNKMSPEKFIQLLRNAHKQPSWA